MSKSSPLTQDIIASASQSQVIEWWWKGFRSLRLTIELPAFDSFNSNVVSCRIFLLLLSSHFTQLLSAVVVVAAWKRSCWVTDHVYKVRVSISRHATILQAILWILFSTQPSLTLLLSDEFIKCYLLVIQSDDKMKIEHSIFQFIWIGLR